MAKITINTDNLEAIISMINDTTINLDANVTTQFPLLISLIETDLFSDQITKLAKQASILDTNLGITMLRIGSYANEAGYSESAIARAAESCYNSFDFSYTTTASNVIEGESTSTVTQMGQVNDTRAFSNEEAIIHELPKYDNLTNIELASITKNAIRAINKTLDPTNMTIAALHDISNNIENFDEILSDPERSGILAAKIYKLIGNKNVPEILPMTDDTVMLQTNLQRIYNSNKT